MIRTGKGIDYFCRNCNTEISYSRVKFRDSLCIECFKKLICTTENLCLNCPDEIRGICCYFLTRIEGHSIYLSNHPCKYLNPNTRKCSIYENRHEINPNCLTLKEMYVKGTLLKNCPYVINDSIYQKRKDTALLTLPFNISNKGKSEFSKLNNQKHYEIGCYDIIRTPICPKCESGNIIEEWADKKDVLFFKYKCEACNHKWNNFEKQIEFNKRRFQKVE